MKLNYFSYLEIYLKTDKFLPLCFKLSFSLSNDSTYSYFSFELEQFIVQKIKVPKFPALCMYNSVISCGHILPSLLAEHGHAFPSKDTKLG